MITRVVFICFCFVLITPTKVAGTVEQSSIDCKNIDQQKFKELFAFKFGGGSRGLFLDFDFVSRDKAIFKVENCEFLIKETKVMMPGAKSFKRQGDKKKLGNLKPCAKYDVSLMIQNLASKKEFTYENTVFTKLDKNKIILKVDKVENVSATFSWNSAELSCVTNFKLTVKNKKNETVYEEENVKDGLLVVDKLSACDVYSAQMIAVTGRDEILKSDEKSFILKSDKIVEDLRLSIDNLTSDSVTLSWTSNSLSCLLEYKLNLRDNDDKIVYAASFFSNNAVITKLTSCSNYSVELIALDDEKLALKAVNKTFVTHSTSIDNLEIKVNGSKARISWNAPPQIDCIVNFNVSYTIENCNFQIDDNISCFHTETVDKNSRSVSLTSLPLAERFSLMLYANEFSSSDASRAKNKTFSTIDYDKFFVNNINEFRMESSQLQLRWSIDNYFSKILKHFEIFFDDKVITAARASVILNIAACKKNYTIAIRCVSFDSVYGPNVSYQTALNDDDVQLSSLYNSITSKQVGKKIIISWKPSIIEQPCILYYEIDFNNQRFKTEYTQKEINEFVPCIAYNIDITPMSRGGRRGLTSTFEFTTEEIVPEPPTSFDLVEAGHNDLTMTATLSDNDKHCNSSSIEFRCDDKISVAPFGTSIVKLTGLSTFWKLNCSSRVKNNVGASEWTEAKLFMSKKDGPQKPVDLKYSIDDDGHVVVMWTPDNSNGLADSFKVHVVLESYLDENIPKECRFPTRTESFLYPREPKVTLKLLRIFTKYSVRVSSVNDYGDSALSEKLYIETKPAAPSRPERLRLRYDFSLSDESTVYGILEWNRPCEMNGKFSFYIISLHGTRPGLADHSIKEATSLQNFTFSDLRRGYRYEAKVNAVNLDFQGASKNLSFTTPSGIPLKKDLESWTTLGSDGRTIKDGKVDLFLRRRMFVSDIGDITGIAFLIFLSNCLEVPQPTFGYISRSNQALPSAHSSENNLLCSVLYQQTEILPNPINSEDVQEGLDDYNLKITLGDAHCPYVEVENRYCNAPLASELNYGIIARVFTSHGFRDTEPVFIEGAIDAKLLVSPKVIVYGSISLLIFSSLIAVLCCIWCSRKKRKVLKEKETAEADENLLSFQSYCVFDRTPTLKKVYNE